jgi:hypothetical protein
MTEVFGFVATKDEKTGHWIYKAKDSVPLTSQKKSKGVYREKPVFKLIEQYEKDAKNTYQRTLRKTVIEITNFLKKNSK